MSPLVVLSDLHLWHSGSAAVARALTELLATYPGHEIVLAGDIFGLSNDPRSRDPIESVCTLLTGQPALLGAIRHHVSRGAPFTLIAGNHDAGLTKPGMREALLERLELTETAPLTIEPWFIRRGRVHVEHGHVWDPDNAPAHPLAPWSTETEPLGVALTRRFVARNAVWEFAHAHETTFIAGLRRAFRLFGARTPGLVARYFATSSSICAETLLDRGLSRAREHGERALAQQASATGVAAEALQTLLSLAPRPTHLAFRDTFLRLYFDRVLSAIGLGAGTLWTLLRRSPAGMALALGGGAYWAWNVRHSGSRYQNQPVRRLREGASVVARVTGAELVVFGHTHVAERDGVYANAGSFGYPPAGRGRPYLVVSESGSAELRAQA